MSDWWVLLALGLLLPLSVPAALLGTHLTMPDFSVPDRGVAVIRMRWLVIRLLRADMRVRVPSAEFLLGDTGDTSLTFQSVSSAAWLWLLLRTSVPAALLGTHLTMPDFSVPDRGVAVI